MFAIISFTLGSTYVNTGAFFRPEAGCAFHCCRSALFRLENGTFSTGTTTVENYHGSEAYVLVVWAPSSWV